MHSHYDKSFYKVYGRWITHLNAVLRNRLRNLSGYLTSCLAGDDQVSEKHSFDIPNQPNFFAFNVLTSVAQDYDVTKTIIPSSGKDPFMHA